MRWTLKKIMVFVCTLFHCAIWHIFLLSWIITLFGSGSQWYCIIFQQIQARCVRILMTENHLNKIDIVICVCFFLFFLQSQKSWACKRFIVIRLVVSLLIAKTIESCWIFSQSIDWFDRTINIDLSCNPIETPSLLNYKNIWLLHSKTLKIESAQIIATSFFFPLNSFFHVLANDKQDNGGRKKKRNAYTAKHMRSNFEEGIRKIKSGKQTVYKMPYCLKRWLLSGDWANDFSIPCVWLISLVVVVVFSFDMILLAQNALSLRLSLSLSLTLTHWTGRAMRITIEHIECFVLLAAMAVMTTTAKATAASNSRALHM